MIRIEPGPWKAMLAHAVETYPNECCGAMLGLTDGDAKTVRETLRLENAFAGAQATRYVCVRRTCSPPIPPRARTAST